MCLDVSSLFPSSRAPYYVCALLAQAALPLHLLDAWTANLGRDASTRHTCGWFICSRAADRVRLVDVRGHRGGSARRAEAARPRRRGRGGASALDSCASAVASSRLAMCCSSFDLHPTASRVPSLHRACAAHLPRRMRLMQARCESEDHRPGGEEPLHRRDGEEHCGVWGGGEPRVRVRVEPRVRVRVQHRGAPEPAQGGQEGEREESARRRGEIRVPEVEGQRLGLGKVRWHAYDQMLQVRHALHTQTHRHTDTQTHTHTHK
jgi:hypothetical protein